MPAWWTKALVQGAISLLPASEKINFYFQRYLTKGLRLNDDLFQLKLQNTNQHITHYQQFIKKSTPNSVLELGTGWLPIVPIALALCGVEHITTIDLYSHLRPNLMSESLAFFRAYIEQNQLTNFLPQAKNERLDLFLNQQTNSPMNVLANLGIQVVVGDASSFTPKIPPEMICSNSTLEHIPAKTIEHIFRHFRNISASQALMSQLIDLSDHYAHFDAKITPYHFFRYSSQQWQWLNNDLHYQNRLRISDYRQLHQITDWDLVMETNRKPDTPPNVPIHSEFGHYPFDDLWVTHSWMVSVISNRTKSSI